MLSLNIREVLFNSLANIFHFMREMSLLEAIYLLGLVLILFVFFGPYNCVYETRLMDEVPLEIPPVPPWCIQAQYYMMPNGTIAVRPRKPPCFHHV
jgi:hypothetical protein